MAVDYTFARLSPATVVDHERIVRNCKIDEARFQGARWVENLIDNTVQPTTAGGGSVVEDFTNNVATVLLATQGHYLRYGNTSGSKTAKWTGCMSLVIEVVDADPGTVLSLRCNGTGIRLIPVEVVTSPSRFTLTADRGDNFNFELADVMLNTGSNARIKTSLVQLEDVTRQSNKNPSEYFSNGLGEDHGCGKNVDGVKYFDYKNGNTVDANGVVTEAKGSAIPGIAYLNEAASTNVVLTSADLGETIGTSEWVGGAPSFFPTYNLVPSIFPGGVAFQATSKASTGRARTASVTGSLIVEDQFWVASFYVEVFKGQGGHPRVRFGVCDGGTGGSVWWAAGRGSYDGETEILSLDSATNSDSSVSMKKLTPVGPNGGQVILFNMVFNAQHFTGDAFSLSIYPMGTTNPLDGGMTIIHGGQLEKGKTPSSFIITDASPVLRAADILSYTGVNVHEDFVAGCDVTPAIDPSDLSDSDIRLFSSSAGMSGSNRTEGGAGENITIDGAVEFRSVKSGMPFSRLKDVYSAVQKGADSEHVSYRNGSLLKSTYSTASVLSHTADGQWNVGRWAFSTDVFPCLYHSFQLFDKPLTDEQLEYISQPGNNPKGCS